MTPESAARAPALRPPVGNPPPGPPATSRTAQAPVRTIALINPLGDYGISQYTYELAEGLARRGVGVTVYASDRSLAEHASLPRQHRYLTVLGSLLLRQKRRLGADADRRPPDTQDVSSLPVRVAARTPKGWWAVVRNWALMIELAWHLRRMRYDVVWTQWPNMGPSSQTFWRLCKLLGLRTAHTAHNVLPHEEAPRDRALCASVYRYSDTLFVHSEAAREAMRRTFPEAQSRTFVTRHGLYTLYPRRPESRELTRARLAIGRGQVAILFAGGPRPYKNVDAALAGLAALPDNRAVLIVSGTEAGYEDPVPDAPLGRTRRLAERLGVTDRVIFVPGNPALAEVVELFEAADALILPYREHYGSGQLLLGMTYGKFIIASRAGGMDEYLRQYPRHEILEDFAPSTVSQAIERAVRRITALEEPPPPSHPELQWGNIAQTAIDLLQR